MKKFCVGVLLTMATIGFVGCGKSSSSFPCPDTCQHEDTYTGLDFKDDVVVVIIKESFKTRDFSVNDFKIVNAREINWVTQGVPNVDRHIINVVLTQPGRQNVICAVKLIGTLEYVYAAEPDFSFTPSPD